MDLEVFADVWCPFAHVGLRAVVAARDAAGRTDVGIVVRSWPLELVNGAPMDPAKTERNAAALRQQVAPTLFAGLDVAHFPTSTIDALALAARAYRTGGAAAGERVSFGLRDALFEHGRDLADPAVLADLAAGWGVEPADDEDRARVRADWEEGQRRGVIGSPHFFWGDTDVFCPALSITRTPEAGLSIEADQAKLDAFLRRCFAPA